MDFDFQTTPMRVLRRTTTAVLLLTVLSSCGGQDEINAAVTQSNNTPDLAYKTDHIKLIPSKRTDKFTYFLKGSIANNQDFHRDAAFYYNEGLKNNPDSDFFKQKTFFQHLIAGQFSLAAPGAAEIAQETGSDTAFLLAICHALKQNNGEQALDLLRSAPRSNFNYIIHPILTGWAAVQMQDKASAYAVMDEFASNPPLRLLALEHKAYMAEYLGDYTEAEKNYRIIFEQKQSNSLQSAIAFISFLARSDRASEAKDTLLKATKKFPRSAALMRNSNAILSGDKRYIPFAQPNGNIENILEILARDISERYPNLALDYYNLAAFMNPGRYDLRLQQADLLMVMEKYSLAAARYASVPSVGPFADQAMLGQIRALISAEKNDQALGLLKAAEASKPNDIRILTLMGDYYRGQEEFKQSAAYFEKILAIKTSSLPQDWYFYFALGICYEQMDQWDKAEGNLLYALKLSPDQPDVLNYLGYSWIDQGINKDRAREMIEKAAKASPDNGYIIDSLGWIYYLMGDFALAVETLEKAVLIEPGDAVLHDHLGDAYWQVGRKREARFQWRHALDSDPDAELKNVIETKLEIGL